MKMDLAPFANKLFIYIYLSIYLSIYPSIYLFIYPHNYIHSTQIEVKSFLSYSCLAFSCVSVVVFYVCVCVCVCVCVYLRKEYLFVLEFLLFILYYRVSQLKHNTFQSWFIVLRLEGKNIYEYDMVW